MPASTSKRKDPPPASPAGSLSKRQRLSSPAGAATRSGRSGTPASHKQTDTSAAASPGNDSLSSLTDDESRASSPEVELVHAVKASASAAGNGVEQKNGRRKGRGGKAGGATAEADEDEERVAEAAAEGHHVVSAKTVPSEQPAPGAVAGKGRNTQGGKGRKGEEALEHAVAAREEVERRRAQLKEVNGVGVAGAREMGEDLGSVKLKVKQEEEDVEVVHGEEAEEIAAPPRKERPAVAEEQAGIIRFVTVTNDSKPDSMIILTGLKNIFQKQLPKMPREYIARLVFDRAHWSMAIVKRGLEVVGGITYRPFEGQKFAEIVFCAITGTEQVKGYGSHLMNHLKDHVKASTSCMHFLTYADNYAIGYFKKQGFTKEIQLDRSVWAGYIKDYEGGTIMHCSMLPRVKYLDVRAMLAQQKEVVLAKIRLLSQSHVVHPGLQFFAKHSSGTKIDPGKVPGLKESGWTPEMDELTRRPKRGPQFAVMKKLLTLLIDHPSSWAFANPVNAQEVTDYYDVIKEPMDFATMESKLEANSYETLEQFLHDAKLIFSNCRQYNDLQSNYVKNANKLENYLDSQVKVYVDQ
ncbi:histone acetyltransferase GCN5 [Rhodotorula paludigena]|uniref:histone acetyltransferase GCN5 n=1 Tax=Rhodotorula paludigena TaxID=86838 RepID=UPI00316BAE85